MANGDQTTGFDVDAARKAGYSDDEILQHLTQSRNFDIDAASKAGYSKSEIINHLATIKPMSAPSMDIAEKAASQATGLSADTRGPLGKAWDEIKAGLTAAQPKQGLKPQPTTLGNMAQFAGMAASTASQLLPAPEAAGGAALVENAIPSTERAGAAFESLSKTIGEHPVQITDEVSNSLTAIKKAVATTGSNAPGVVTKLINRLDPFQGSGPLTYNEARAFSSDIGQLSASDRMAMNPKMQRLVTNLGLSLKSAVQNTADVAGKGEQLSKAMQEYHSAMTLRGYTDAAKEAAWKAIITGTLGAVGGGAGYEAWKWLKGANQ